MEREVKQQMKEQGTDALFTPRRYLQVKEMMGYAMSKDPVLKEYLSISPDFKVDFICDHIVKLSNSGHI